MSHTVTTRAIASSTLEANLRSLCRECFAPSYQPPAWASALVGYLAGAAARRRTLENRLQLVTSLLTTIDELFVQARPAEYLANARSIPERNEQAAGFSRWINALYSEAARLLEHNLLPALDKVGVGIRRVDELNDWQFTWARSLFYRQYYPVLTPLAVDPGHPFPYISSGSANLLVELQRPEQVHRNSRSVLYARVKIPRFGPMLLAAPQSSGETLEPVLGYGDALSPVVEYPVTAASFQSVYLWTCDLVRGFVHELFPGMVIRNVYLFRLLRAPQAEFSDAPYAAGGRRQGATPVIRLEVDDTMPGPVVRWLADHVQAPAYAIANVPRAVDLFGLPALLQALPWQEQHQAALMTPALEPFSPAYAATVQRRVAVE